MTSPPFSGPSGRVVVELLRLVGSGVPDDDLAAAVLPLGNLTRECQVLHRVILGMHRKVIDRWCVGQVLRDRPRHQHSVAFQPEVVVQSTGMVLLDDERVVVACLRRSIRYRLRCFRRVAHAAVRRQPVGDRHRLVQLGEQIPVFGHPFEYLVEPKVLQLRVVDLVPRSRRGDGRMFSSAKRIRCDRRLGGAVLAPVEEHLAGAQALRHGRGDLFGHRLLQLLRDPLREYRCTSRTDRFGQRHIEMQPLAAAGEGKGGEADVGDEIADLVGHLAQLPERDPLTGIQIEDDACRRTLAPIYEPPLRDMDLERGLLGDPRQPLDGVDQRVGGRSRLMGDRRTIEPFRRGRGELLLEKRGLVDAVGPALAGHRPARDVRNHHLGDLDVVLEDLGLGGTRRGVKHLVGVGELHPTELIHHNTVLPGVPSHYEENLCGVPASGRSRRVVGTARRRRPPGSSPLLFRRSDADRQQLPAGGRPGDHTRWLGSEPGSAERP